MNGKLGLGVARLDVRPPEGARQSPSSPWRAFVVGAVIVVLVVAVVIAVLRSFVFPVFEANSGATRAAATAQAQIDALRARQALTSVPIAAATTVAGPGAELTLAPVSVITPRPTAQVMPAPTTGSAALTVIAVGVTPTVRPTIPAELDAEISQAYLRYFQVSGDALLALDPAGLDQVAVDGELAALEKNIDDDRLQGRALQTNVQHKFVIVSADGDRAEVADRYRDSSIYVDPITQQPLPGQVAPAPENAREVKVIYQLQRIDGQWKVTGGQRYE